MKVSAPFLIVLAFVLGGCCGGGAGVDEAPVPFEVPSQKDFVHPASGLFLPLSSDDFERNEIVVKGMGNQDLEASYFHGANRAALTLKIFPKKAKTLEQMARDLHAEQVALSGTEDLPVTSWSVGEKSGFVSGLVRGAIGDMEKTRIRYYFAEEEGYVVRCKVTSFEDAPEALDMQTSTLLGKVLSGAPRRTGP